MVVGAFLVVTTTKAKLVIGVTIVIYFNDVDYMGHDHNVYIRLSVSVGKVTFIVHDPHGSVAR